MYNGPQNHQFFNSQSSFGTDSKLSNSRCNDLYEQILQGSQAIFYTLRQELVPLQSELQQQRLNLLYNRARILYKENIPETLNLMNKVHGDPQRKRQGHPSTQNLTRESQKLSQFIKDFQEWRIKHHMAYKQFYNKYTKDNNHRYQGAFKKKNNILDSPIIHRTQVVTIVQPKMPGNFMKSSNNSFYLNQSRQGFTNEIKDKQLLQLRQQLHKIHKMLNEVKKQKQLTLTEQKLHQQNRIGHLFQLRWSQPYKKESDEIKMLKSELFACQQNLKSQYQKNIDNKKQAQQFETTINALRNDKRILAEELESYKRIQNSRFSEGGLSEGGKSAYSQFDIPKSDVKKMERIIKNTNAEKNLLRSELHKQRELNYSIKAGKSQEMQDQIDRLKRTIESLNCQKINLCKEYDKIRVQNIKVLQNQKLKGKILQNLKIQNETLKITSRSTVNLKDNHLMSPYKPSNDDQGLSVSSSYNPRPTITDYDGDGIQGYPYYQLLNRQFRTRFRRSCLRQKQLLYKANGLEIGVISQLLQPNEIKVLIHLTNYSDTDFIDFKLKPMNPNDNILKCETSYLQSLKVGDQTKITIYCTVKFYPIGPVILVCQYRHKIVEGSSPSSLKTEQTRVLLPVHIFKMMTYRTRNPKQQLKKRKTFKIKMDKKITRDLQSFLGYFKGISIGEVTGEIIKIEAVHGHTGTVCFLDLKMKGDEVEVAYEGVQGSQQIVQYYVKTLQFLIAK